MSQVGLNIRDWLNFKISTKFSTALIRVLYYIIHFSCIMNQCGKIGHYDSEMGHNKIEIMLLIA